MIRLEKSKALGRLIRQDDTKDLAFPTWDLIGLAIRAGETDGALNLLDYCDSEIKALHDGLCSLVDDALAHLGRIDEEEVYRFLRARYEPAVRGWLSDTPAALEYLQSGLEYQRGHGGTCSIHEDADKHTVICDPCGSGGQLRRTQKAGTVRRAYFWTWGRENIPYYCVHCCVMWEILPMEMRGYPIRINLIGADAQDPCVHHYYKKPELIPEAYFARVGQKKPEGE